jgi:MinD-like ATPase involved in chromosome partitioning or flagellar assembly
MGTQILTYLGAAGGVGTTRLAIECGATLARSGRDVAVFDASFETQGLAAHVTGEIAPDVTTLVTEEVSLEATLYEYGVDTPGRLALCPARAPFERLARAKTAGAARQFERQLAAASLSHDVVLVDTPPLGTNQALAAVNAADRVAVVTVDSRRGRDALAQAQERLDDVGAAADAVVANHSEGSLADADAAIPTSEVTDPENCPACLPPDGVFAPAVADATEHVLGEPLELEFPDSGRVGGLLGS